MADYKISRIAEEDLIRIYRFGVEKFGSKQARKYFNKFFDCFDLIASNPYVFEAVDYIKPGYRRCVCGSDSVYYRIEDEKVEIMTIVGRQDFKL